VKLRKRELWFKAFRGDPRIFLTLTMQHTEDTPDAQAQKFVTAWRMLRQFLCRRLGRKSLTFLAVFERHPTSGWPHLHILLRGGYISRKLILEFWTAYTHSFIVDIRLVKNARQRASYVSKYVAQDPGSFEHVKRYWCSQDWDPPKKEEPRSTGDEFAWWESISIHPLGIARMAHGDGAAIKFEGERLVINGWSQLDRWRWGIG